MKNFTIVKKDTKTAARLGSLQTPHGVIGTPVFMPVATQGVVKAISSEELKNAKVEMVISNTYHLYLRPGADIVKKAGGLHRFMGWDGAITTDSGGFQVFSLASLCKIHDEGVEFSSHLDGSRHFFTPQKVIEIQNDLGSDILMPLDECVKYPSEKGYVKDSVDLTLKWAKESKKKMDEMDIQGKLLFGIVQGGTYKDLRKVCAEELASMDMNGYALGGIGVGEPVEAINEITDYTAGLLPEDKVKYLMGVGTPTDILEAIANGIDMFDCVVPTRNGRNGQAFTLSGEVQVRNAVFKEDQRPLDEECDCYVCRSYTRSYLRHLINAGEITAARLITFHNLYFYSKLISMSRDAIKEGKFADFKKAFCSKFRQK